MECTRLPWMSSSITQQAALLEAVVRDILVLVADHGPATGQRIAVLAIPGVGIGQIDGLRSLQGARYSACGTLGQRSKYCSSLRFILRNLLKADDVRIELFHRGPRL